MEPKITSFFTSVYLVCYLLTTGAGCTYCQNATDDYWLLTCDSIDVESCGYTDKKGAVKIKLGKYPMCFSDTFFNYAIVAYPDSGFCAIDRKEEILYRVYAFDNGPDELQNGLRRIIINKKIGFANKKGNVVIQPVYDFCLPFNNGLAEFCVGCKSVKDKEHTVTEGGNWGFLDTSGQVVIKPEFLKRWNTQKKIFEYSKDDTIKWEPYEVIVKYHGQKK